MTVSIVMVRHSVAAWSLQVLALALFLGNYCCGTLAVEIVDAGGGAAPRGGIGDNFWTVDPVDVNKKQKQESVGGTSNGKQANNNKAANKNKAADNSTGNKNGTPDPQNDNGVDVWSLPKAIANVTGQAPLVGWEKYLSNDPFGEESGIGPIALVDSVGGLTWRSAIRCVNGDRMEGNQYGQELCIGVGEGICTAGGWQFGIRYHDDNMYVMLWRKDDQNSPAYKWFPGATQLCIGDQRLFGSNELDKNDEYKSPSVEYLRVVYERCHYYLIGPGSVKAEKFAKLKISADEDKKKPVEVKFSKLWNIDENGNSETSIDAIWYPIPCQSEGSTISSPIEAKAGGNDASQPVKSEKTAIEGTLPGEAGASWSIPTKAPTAIPLSPSSKPKKACFWRWDASCQDDPSYLSKDNVGCEKYGDVDCPGLLGHFTQPEVSDLIERCPCSCRIECNTYLWEPSSESQTNVPRTEPSGYLSERPTKIPSGSPTRSPTTIDDPAGYALEMTTPTENWIWTRDYSACNRRLQETVESTRRKRTNFQLRFNKRFRDGGEEDVGDDISGRTNYPLPGEYDDNHVIEDRSGEVRTSEREFDQENNVGVDMNVMACIPEAIPLGRASTTPMTATQVCPSVASPFGGPNIIAQVDGLTVPECGGLCASRINRNVLWAINDYSNHHSLYAINSIDGSVQQYPIANGNNYDYEDIACGPGPIPDVGYIYVADIGDNDAWRGMKYFLRTWPPIVIYRVREPNLSTLQDSELTQWDKLELRYTDGPHNAEAMIIDPVSRRIFILTKSSGRIWMTPSEWGPGDASMVLKRVGRIKNMPDSLTGVDISPDGKEIVVKFYDSIHYFCMDSRQYDNPAGAWQDILNVLTVTDGIPVPYEEEPQGEAVCFGPSFDDGMYTLSEAKRSLLVPLSHHERL